MGNAIGRLATSPRLRVAGLMSGTSVDGVDVAIVDITGRAAELLAFGMFPYPAALRREVFRLFEPGAATIADLCQANFAIGEAFAEALIALADKAGIGLDTIDLVGSHGQTVWHEPPVGSTSGASKPPTGSTLQIGEPSVIAQRTGITTVADFRPRDMAAGGQGAPLVPLADLFLFGHKTRARAVQNIGGIANLTYLPAGLAWDGLSPRPRKDTKTPTHRAQTCATKDVLAFDTGPGNMVMDRLAQLVSGGKMHFDRDGLLARAGLVNEKLLAGLLRHPFLSRRPPKSTGREEFGVAFADRYYDRACATGLAASDILATAAAFTARSIALAYRKFLPKLPDEVILCGGGARNPTLVDMLADELAPAEVVLMDSLGIDADAKEAISFAILAAATIRGLPGNIPSATGAAEAVVLGKIVPGR
jgi:anhydro-N-acetylmuramic acid kinase